MGHAGILAHSIGGGGGVFAGVLPEGFRELGPHEHPGRDARLHRAGPLHAGVGRRGPRGGPGDPGAERRAAGARGRRVLRLPGQHRAHRARAPGRDLALPGPAHRRGRGRARRARRPPAGGRAGHALSDGRHDLPAGAGRARHRRRGARSRGARVRGSDDLRRARQRRVHAGLARRVTSRIVDRLARGAATRSRSSAPRSRCWCRPRPRRCRRSTRRDCWPAAAFEVAVGRRPVPSWRGGPPR